MKKAGALFFFLLLLLPLLGGCRLIRIEEEERTPLSYTIVKAEDIPKDLAALILEKKEKEFQMTYELGDTMYLVKGYGRQMTGGFSIQVEELGATSKGVWFFTKLLGPTDPDSAGREPSYPYIVVQTERREEPVLFQP